MDITKQVKEAMLARYWDRFEKVDDMTAVLQIMAGRNGRELTEERAIARVQSYMPRVEALFDFDSASYADKPSLGVLLSEKEAKEKILGLMDKLSELVEQHQEQEAPQKVEPIQ